MPTTRICSSCGQEKPTVRFHRKNKKDDGRENYCLDCPVVLTAATKVCPACEQEKNKSEFNKSKAAFDGLQDYCRVCMVRKNNGYRRANYAKPETVEAKAYEMHHYKERLEAVQMLYVLVTECQICGRPEMDGRELSMDHCHKSGLIRGLLCQVCNRALSWIERELSDEVVWQRVEKALDYIRHGAERLGERFPALKGAQYKEANGPAKRRRMRKVSYLETPECTRLIREQEAVAAPC